MSSGGSSDDEGSYASYDEGGDAGGDGAQAELSSTANDEEFVIVVGPIIGLVTHNMARILVEVAMDGNVEVVVSSDGKSKKEKLKLKRHRPSVFVMKGLKENTLYSVQVKGPTNSKERTGSFKTWPKSGLVDPTSVLAVSCNKPSTLEAGERSLWTKIYEEHLVDHSAVLLLHCGDQVYADSAFEELKVAFPKAPYKAATRDKIKERFRRVYRETWNSADQARALANVSNIMIWDDHEIRDDWGSRPDDSNKDSLDFALGSLAREVYREYQRALVYSSGEGPEDFEYVHQVWGTLGLLVLDTRSGRSFGATEGPQQRAFLGDRQWEAVEAALSGEGLFKKATNLIVVATVPLVFATESVSRALVDVGLDDMKDQWTHANGSDNADLLDLLGLWKAARDGRDVLCIGGDVHFGYYSTIVNKKKKLSLKQIVTSPVTNEPVGAVALAAVTAALEVAQSLAHGWKFEHDDYIGARNFALVAVTEGGMEARHVVDNENKRGWCC